MNAHEYFSAVLSYIVHINDISLRYRRLYTLLGKALREAVESEKIQFNSPIGRLEYAAKKYDVAREIKAAIYTFSHNVRRLDDGEQIDEQTFLADAKAVVAFISAISGEPCCGELAEKLAGVKLTKTIHTPRTGVHIDKIRMTVSRVDATYIYGEGDVMGEHMDIKVRHNVEDRNREFKINEKIFAVGAQVNLLDVDLSEHGEFIPSFIILEPDYLVDCSSISECMGIFGRGPLIFLLKMLQPQEITRPILMGNMANLYHDAMMFGDVKPINEDYLNLTRKAFQQMAVEISCCRDFDDPAKYRDFVEESQEQFRHIYYVVKDLFPYVGVDKDCAVLEPSFVCEDIGVQGRLDFLQVKRGDNIVVELKSGRTPWPDNDYTAITSSHKMQASLYQMMIQRNLGIPFSQLRTFICYSSADLRTQSNLRQARPTMTELKQLLNMRNTVTYIMRSLAFASSTQTASKIIGSLTYENLANRHERLKYPPYGLDQYRAGVDKASPLERAYYLSFVSFVAREQIYSKMGGGSHEGNQGFASTWRSSVAEKLEAGQIMIDLTIVQNDLDGINPSITLSIPQRTGNVVSCFRQGDAVILYERNKYTDTVTSKQVFKGQIASISNDEITLSFRQRQHNKQLVNADSKYAIEPDYLDSSYRAIYNSLFAFLKSSKERRNLLLGLTLPTSERGVHFSPALPIPDDKDVARIILKSKEAQDYFLLIGPPGTGKTSVTLKRMIEEAYVEGKTLLLLSYTNRAVDEICAAIEDSDLTIPYTRIGAHLSTDKRYHSHLLSEQIAGLQTRKEVKQVIEGARIIVGTTSSIAGKSTILEMLSFDLCIIDEASQILEPQIVGILSAMNCGEPSIKKFIMIGDHKQLPAVVQQSERESRIPLPDREMFDQISLTDRRGSLFERLYRINRDKGNTAAYDMLTRQGRMHPAISEFPNKAFYGGKLLCVPLPHQKEETLYATYDASDPLEARIATHRIDYFATKAEPYGPTNKVNTDEAHTAVEIAKRCISLAEKNGKRVTAKSIGIITTYRSQISLIRDMLNAEGIDQEMITIDTVERYQGSQRDIIIYSACVNEAQQLSFISCVTEDEGQQIDRKLNVALTRARRQLFVLGCEEILRQSSIYDNLITHIQNHNIQH